MQGNQSPINSNKQSLQSLKRMKKTALQKKISGLLVSAVLLAGALPNTPAAAAENASATVELAPITVTAKGQPVPLSMIPGSVGVIEKNEISVRNPVSIADLLFMIPGLSRESDSAWGSEVNIRGMSRESIVFLIDGIRVNTATDLNGRFGMIDPQDIERIEVLKGPVSSLYGSGSFGGVVNVITRDSSYSEKLRVKTGLSAAVESNPAGYDARARAEFSSPNVKVYVFQSYRDHDSYKDGDGDTVRNSQFRDNYSKLRLGYRVTETYELNMNLQYYEGHEIGIPGTGVAPLPEAADVTYPETRRGLFSIGNNFIHDLKFIDSSTFVLFYQFIDRRVRIDNFPAASPLEKIMPRADHNTFGSYWMGFLRTDSHILTAGADLWQRKLENSHRRKYMKTGAYIDDHPLPEARFTSAGVFVEEDWLLNDSVTVSAGARFDLINLKNDSTENYEEDDNTDTSWNMHIGTTLKLSDSLDASLLAARGYRAPSLEERFKYIQLGGGVANWGNPDLDPEESLFFESGLTWRSDRAFAGISAFANLLDNMIGEERVSESLIVNANINKAEIYGLEAQGGVDLLQGLSAYGNIACASGRNTTESDYLPYIPPVSGLIGIASEASNGFCAKLESVFAFRQDKTPSGIEETPGWFTLNAGVNWQLKGRFNHSIFAGVNNILDRNYQNYMTTHRGLVYNEPGRSFNAGYEIVF